ncbi:unnamed protein product [Diplocarpon coronariae]
MLGFTVRESPVDAWSFTRLEILAGDTGAETKTPSSARPPVRKVWYLRWYPRAGGDRTRQEQRPIPDDALESQQMLPSTSLLTAWPPSLRASDNETRWRVSHTATPVAGEIYLTWKKQSGVTTRHRPGCRSRGRSSLGRAVQVATTERQDLVAA